MKENEGTPRNIKEILRNRKNKIITAIHRPRAVYIAISEPSAIFIAIFIVIFNAIFISIVALPRLHAPVTEVHREHRRRSHDRSVRPEGGSLAASRSLTKATGPGTVGGVPEAHRSVV